MSETTTKPYLIRAIHEWCMDNGYRPYLAVAVDERTVVPREFVRGGEIVLNVSSDATNRLHLGNEFIEFEARFNQVARQVSIPVENVTAIYAAENGHGMAFEVPKAPAVPQDEPENAPQSNPDVASEEKPPSAPAPRGSALLSAVPRQGDETSSDGEGPDDTPPPPSGRPKLTRIK